MNTDNPFSEKSIEDRLMKGMLWANKPVLILGLPRSGTSMITGLLQLSGLWLGDTVPGGTQENMKGFFESKIIREQITKMILARLGCDPLGVQKLPDLNALPDGRGMRNLVLKAISIDKYDGNSRWGYKDAKTSLIWPMWRDAFPAATYIIVERDPEEVVRSCLNTSFMKQHSTDPDYWRQFINEYQKRLTILENSQEMVMKINSNDIVRGDLTTFKDLVTTLALNYCEADYAEFVDNNLWHNRNK